MSRQQILFKENNLANTKYTIKIPKIVNHVSPFEMNFGFKQPGSYLCGDKKSNAGVESTTLHGYTNNIRL